MFPLFQWWFSIVMFSLPEGIGVFYRAPRWVSQTQKKHRNHFSGQLRCSLTSSSANSVTPLPWGVPRVGFHENCREKVFTDLGSDKGAFRIGWNLTSRFLFTGWKPKSCKNICLEKKKRNHWNLVRWLHIYIYIYIYIIIKYYIYIYNYIL